MQSELNNIYNFCEQLKEENQILKIQLSAKHNDLNRCLKPGNHRLFDRDSFKASSRGNSEKRRSNSRCKKSIIPEVKKWIAKELSKYFIKDEVSSQGQIFANVEDDNPLFPVVEMAKNYAAKLTEKEALLAKSENDCSKSKAEILNLEAKIPSIINKKMLETKMDIQKEINIGLQTEGGSKLNKVIEILNAFGINAQNTEKEEEDAFLQVVKFDSNKLIPPPSKAQFNTSRSKRSEIEISSNNSESPVRNSMNKFDSGERNYLRDLSLNFDKNDESVNFTVKNKPEPQGHQV